MITEGKLGRPEKNILTYTWLNPKIDSGWAGPDKNEYELFSSEEIAVVFAFYNTGEYWDLAEKICRNLSGSLGNFFDERKLYVEKSDNQVLLDYLQQRKNIKLIREFSRNENEMAEFIQKVPFYSYSHPDKKLLNDLGVFISACEVQKEEKSRNSAERYIGKSGYGKIPDLKRKLPVIFTEFSGDVVFGSDNKIIPTLDAKISVVNPGGEKAAENAANGLVSLLKGYDGPLLPDGAWWTVRDIYREEARAGRATKRSLDMRKKFF